MHKTCASPSQTKPSTKRGAGDATTSIAVELLAPVSCWERDVFSKSVVLVKSAMLEGKTMHQ